MNPCARALDELDWHDIAAQLDTEGYALLPRMLAPEHARELAHESDLPAPRERATPDPDDAAPGERLFFGPGLPAPWSAWRTTLYRRLAPIANRWNETLDVGYRYPAELDAFLRHNREAGQTRPLSHLTRLRSGEYLALHQNDAGERVFPLQLVALLSEPGRDFQGGEFVLTESDPRRPGRAEVVPLRQGDAVVLAVNHRPVRSARGYYRAELRHGVSKLHRGERHALGVIFHDAR